MTRVIISLSENDKRWLDQYSALHGQATSEVIHDAIQFFRRKVSSQALHQTLKNTSGILKSKPDGAKSIQRLRNEWN